MSVVFLLGAMFYMDWRLEPVRAVGAPLRGLQSRQAEAAHQARVRPLACKESGELNSMLTQTLQSMRVVKAYGQEANEARRFRPDRRTTSANTS